MIIIRLLQFLRRNEEYLRRSLGFIRAFFFVWGFDERNLLALWEPQP
jgi:hypothetical protein